MKLVTIVGARPQFVKAAAVSREINRLKSLGEDVDEIIIHTGQHFDSNMSDIFFKEMSIPEPHYNLHINSLSHGAMTGQMLEKIEAILMYWFTAILTQRLRALSLLKSCILKLHISKLA
jgi:UDP-GlcNAc3NAcA epimerase